MQPATTPRLPTIGFSTNVLNHPTNTALAPADVATAVAFLSERFGAVEIEISEDAQPAVLECGHERYDALVASLRETAQRTGVRLSVHAPWFGEATNLASPSADERARSITLLSRAVDFGADIGARIVTCHPGYHEGQEREIFNRHLHESLVEAVCYAESRGVQISLENMGDERPSYIVHSVEEQIAMCQATGARVTLDVIHLRSRYDSEADFLDALTQIAPYVANVHIADMKGRNHAHVPIGDGDFPLDEVLHRLGAAGYEGGAIVEEFVRNCDFQRFLDKAIDYRARFEGHDRARDVTGPSTTPGGTSCVRATFGPSRSARRRVAAPSSSSAVPARRPLSTPARTRVPVWTRCRRSAPKTATLSAASTAPSSTHRATASRARAPAAP